MVTDSVGKPSAGAESSPPLRGGRAWPLGMGERPAERAGLIRRGAAGYFPLPEASEITAPQKKGQPLRQRAAEAEHFAHPGGVSRAAEADRLCHNSVHKFIFPPELTAGISSPVRP